MNGISNTKEFLDIAMTPVLQACSRNSAPASRAGAPAEIEAVHAAADSLHVEMSKVRPPPENSARSLEEETACFMLIARESPFRTAAWAGGLGGARQPACKTSAK